MRLWCFKIKFFALTHPINLHHRDDIYYLFLSTILLQNMMVEESVSNDKMEDGSFYNTIDPNDSEENSTDEGDVWMTGEIVIMETFL